MIPVKRGFDHPILYTVLSMHQQNVWKLQMGCGAE